MSVHANAQHSKGKKRAILIACTYNGAASEELGELKYAYKDIDNLKNLLTRFEFSENEITVLTDKPGYEAKKPTRENILKELSKLVKDTKSGDTLFVHFSGHGSQQEARDDIYEVDGLDEYILPVDFVKLRNEGKVHYILDDTLRQVLVDNLPAEAKLIALFDSSSSGTILDLPYNLEQQPTASDPQPNLSANTKVSPAFGLEDSRIIHGDVICISSCADSTQSFESSDGGLLVTQFCNVLNQALDNKKEITLNELKESIKERIAHIHEIAKTASKEQGNEWMDDWSVPVPQYSFSRVWDMNTPFSLSA